jgi:hypothetical protein
MTGGPFAHLAVVKTVCVHVTTMGYGTNTFTIFVDQIANQLHYNN